MTSPTKPLEALERIAGSLVIYRGHDADIALIRAALAKCEENERGVVSPSVAKAELAHDSKHGALSWDERRKEFEQTIREVAMDLFGHTGSGAWRILIPATTPPLYVVCGEVDQIHALLPQRAALAKAEENERDRDWIADVIRDVAELPDRDSPDDRPEAMLVTGDELRRIIEGQTSHNSVKSPEPRTREPTMDETPRTDAAIHFAFENFSHERARSNYVANFAKELERALAAKERELAEARQQVEVRAGMYDAATLRAEQAEAKLAAALADAEQWKHAADMYSNAWQRELRLELIPKAHLIDSLVLSTRAIVEKAGRQVMCCGALELCGDEWCNKLLRYRLAARGAGDEKPPHPAMFRCPRCGHWGLYSIQGPNCTNCANQGFPG